MFSFVACAAVDDATFMLVFPVTTLSGEGWGSAMASDGFFGDQALLPFPLLLLSVVGGFLVLLDDDFLVVVTIADAWDGVFVTK